MTTIQFRRQGVSNTQRSWFAPCPHAEHWHIEVNEVCVPRPGWSAELSYPNCAECYGAKRGQIAWSNHNANRDTIEAAKRDAKAAISRRIGGPVEFSPDIEAYTYAKASELRIWPHIATDVYLLACSFEPSTNTIRHEPTNVCLIAFDGPTEARFDIDRAAKPYRSEIDRALPEFLKSHVQRDGEYDAKCWLAWLLSEYIKKSHTGERPVRRRYVARNGRGEYAGPDTLSTATAPALT